MLGGQRRRALDVNYAQGRPYPWSGGNVSEKPDWDNAPNLFVGASNRTSYNHKQPGAYRTKDERPGSTGVYKKDRTLGLRFAFASLLASTMSQQSRLKGRKSRGV